MDFSFNDIQREIQTAAERLLAETASFEQVTALAESDLGFDRDAYSQIAELGWTGLQVPESLGGAGLTQVELIVLTEQMGRVLYPSPFFASVCLAANALVEAAAVAELSDDNAALLAAIVAGEQTATLAHDQARGKSVDGPSVRSDGGDLVISGRREHVLDGATADVVILEAYDDEGRTQLLAVPGDAAGLTRTAMHSVDLTRRIAALDFDDVRVPVPALLTPPETGAQVLETTLQLASVALAAESLGAAQRCFDTALTYTKDRHQFGRTIASFQAVKHICADLLMLVEAARSASYYAGWVAAEERSELPQIAPLAKAQAAESLWEVSRTNIQLHGGIGFTYEHEAHWYYRRATASRVLLGTTSRQRELLLEGLGV